LIQGIPLKANGLEARDTISDISSRLIVNKAAMKMKHAGIKEIIDSLEKGGKIRYENEDG
jgi:ATP phosphoribosyltransferase